MRLPNIKQSRVLNPIKFIKLQMNYKFFAALFLTFLINVNYLPLSFSQGEIRAKDTTVENILKRVIAENKRLKEANSDLQESLNRLNAKINIYVERVKRLTARIDELQKQSEQEKSKANQEKALLEEELENQAKELRRLNKVIAYLRQEKEEDTYFIGWRKTRQEIKDLSKKFKEIARGREEMKNEIGKLHYNFGNILFKSGDYKKAVYEYEKALTLLPKDSDVAYNLAVIYDYHLKDHKKAVLYYNIYLNQTPEADDALEVKERIADNQFNIDVDKDYYKDKEFKDAFIP